MPPTMDNPRQRLVRGVGLSARQAPGAAEAAAVSLESEVESLLGAMKQSQESLLAAVREHRDAISRADQRAIQAGLERHRQAIEEIRGVEEQRVRLGARIGGRSGGTRVTLGEILGRVPGAARERLAVLAAGVREVAITAQREQRALGEASLALAGHMEGLMRGVSARVSEAGTYGRRGYVETGGRGVGTLDVSR